MDFALFDACMKADDGDWRALADWVASGGKIDGEDVASVWARSLIAAHLSGTVERRPGQKRTRAQRDADSTTLMLVEYLARRDKVIAELEREGGRKYRPKGGETLYLEARPGMSENTLKTILTRARRDRRNRNRVAK